MTCIKQKRKEVYASILLLHIWPYVAYHIGQPIYYPSGCFTSRHSATVDPSIKCATRGGLFQFITMGHLEVSWVV
jgi:hypothetical protein